MVMDEEIKRRKSEGGVAEMWMYWKMYTHINADRFATKWFILKDENSSLLISNLLIPWQKGGWEWEKEFPSYFVCF